MLKGKGTSALQGERILPVILVLIIMLIGLVNLYSSTQPAGKTALVVKQLIWDTTSIFLLLLILNVPWRTQLTLIKSGYFITLLLLTLVMLAGEGPGGVKRWIALPFLRIQPSEIAKPFTVATLAVYLAPALRRSEFSDWKKIFTAAFIVLPPAFLIAFEPDLGTAVILVLTCGSILLLTGLSRKTMIITLSLSLLSAPLFWKYGLKPYQKKRLLTFVHPENDPLGAGYQTIQSKITVGSGGLWGKGYRKGTQTRLRFLPEQHTDFAFSVWAEEWGFTGSVFVIILYFLLSLFFADAAIRAETGTSMLLNAGVSVHITLHAFFNLGMVTGILPVVGLPLPFFSYGGSATLATCIMMALALKSREISFEEIPL